MPASHSVLDRILYVLFIPVLLIFLLYIYIGYFLSISTGLPDTNRLTIGFVVLLITILVFFIIRTAAFEFNRAYHARTIGAFVSPALVFLILLAFSAYGFLSSSVLFFEGPIIARDSVGSAIGTLQTLSSRAPDLLAARDYEALASRVNANQTQLVNEIQNVAAGYCGVGDKAKQAIAKIRQDLPQVDVVSGTDRNHDCRDRSYTAGLATLYRNLIQNALTNSEVAKAARLQDRRDVLQLVRTTTATHMGRLREVEGTLDHLSSFMLNIRAYYTTVEALNQAASDYGRLLAQISPFADPVAAGLPAAIDSASLGRISSGIQVIDTILGRIHKPSMLLLLALAVVCDMLATLITFKAIRHKNQHDVERRSVRESLELSRTGVDYIWRPLIHPLRRD